MRVEDLPYCIRDNSQKGQCFIDWRGGEFSSPFFVVNRTHVVLEPLSPTLSIIAVVLCVAG